MTVQVTVFRASAVWSLSFIDLLESPPDQGAPLSWVGTPAEFKVTFDEAQRAMKQRKYDESAPPEIDVPWEQPYGKQFWGLYVGATPGDIRGEDAWNAFVPFRTKAALRTKAPWFPGSIYHEAYLYPHGVAFVLHAVGKAGTGEPALSLENVRAACFDLIREEAFEVTRAEGEPVEELKAEALAKAGLEEMRCRMIGSVPPNAASVVGPFTVVTVVRATGADPTTAPPEGGAVNKFLDAVASCDPSFRHGTLPSLEQARVDLRSRAPDSHLVYGTKRGRAVWFPIAMASANSPTLACYHRNLTFGAMQVDMLGLHLEATTEWSNRARELSGLHRQNAKRAAHLLGNLYQGAGRLFDPSGTTFRSGSVKRHIQEQYLQATNRMRRQFEQAELS